MTDSFTDELFFYVSNFVLYFTYLIQSVSNWLYKKI